MAKKKKKRFPLWLKVIISFAAIAIIMGGIAFNRIYKVLYQSNVFLGERKNMHIFIPTGSNYQDVKRILTENGILLNVNTFEWLAERKNYPNNVKPGRYLIKANWGNNELINLLRSGQQDPVKLKFNNLRTKQQLAGSISKQLELDSLSLIRIIESNEEMGKYGLNSETAVLLFLPNTYEFYWNTSAEEFVERMSREYKNFWDDSRKEKAEKMGLNPVKVAILASIVQMETNKKDEMPRIAGVYLNRLKINQPLQADPSVVFAVGDFTIKRVLNKHLEYDSPYNTYKYAGLPPGPITIPEPTTIDKVLDFEQHNYFYFCAKDDFSGYHVFSRNYSQHLQNARRYQQALNARNIKR